ncbi:YbaB/EbfC family nucleoid-associated protein [bacterium]|nr:YbaB/EbfC family nucleoid-associated protein [bacterium]MBR4617873.1 YbaB/EbfC family nucleoid-associated protein [Bacilli bacterium]
MNMQAMLKQAQNMQRDMMKIKKEIDETEFTGESSFVTVTVNGKKEIVNVVINADEVDKDDLDMISDLFVVATNNAMKKVDDITEKKMAKFGNIPGMF